MICVSSLLTTASRCMGTHIVHRNGRFAAKFHGLRFDPLSMVMYINGLTNNIERPEDAPQKDLWDRLKEWF